MNPIYCFEAQTDYEHCRLTLPKEKYTILLSLKTEDEKLKFLNECWCKLDPGKISDSADPCVYGQRRKPCLL